MNCITLLCSLVLMAGISANSYAGAKNKALVNTIKILTNKNCVTIEYLKNSHIALVTEKIKLFKTKRINGNAAFSIGNNNVTKKESGIGKYGSPVLKYDMQSDDLSIWLDYQPGNLSYMNTAGVMLPVVSPRIGRCALLDSMITIEKNKAACYLENIFLEDLKRIWGVTIEILQLDEEIKIKKRINRTIDSVINILEVLDRAGQLNRRSVNLLNLNRLESKLQIAQLGKKLQLKRLQIQNQYYIQQGMLDSLLVENRTFIEKQCNNTQGYSSDISKGSVTERLDSLNNHAVALRSAYELYDEVTFKIGPIITMSNNFRQFEIGAGAQINLIINNNKQLREQGPINVQKIRCYEDHVEMSFMDEKEYGVYHGMIDDEIKKILDELRSGVHYSLPWLNDLFSKMKYSQIDFLNQKVALMQYKVSIIHSLKDIAISTDELLD